MKGKRLLNKSGATLTYVLGISILLLILCSATILMARHNLSTWSRTTDGRQTFVNAGSAVEFAKSEIYRLAGEDVSNLAMGDSSYQFFIKKTENASFEVSPTKPVDKEFAAKCDFTLKETQHVLKRTIKVWVDGVPFKEAISGHWTVADYEQQFVTLSPSPPPNPATIAYKEFDLGWITSGEVIIQIVDDEYTRHVYNARVDAEVSYEISNRTQQSAFLCEVVPGYTVKHTAMPPHTDGEPPTLASWVATGENYGTTMLSENSAFATISSAVKGHDTPQIKQNVASAFPIFYSARVYVPGGNYTIKAPGIYFYGSTEEPNSPVQAFPSLCLANGASLNLDSEYIFFDRHIFSHGKNGNEHVNVTPKKNSLVRFNNLNSNYDGVTIYKSNAPIATIPSGDYKYTQSAIDAGTKIDLMSLTDEDSDNPWSKYFVKIEAGDVPTYIATRNELLGNDISSSALYDQIISSEINKKITTGTINGKGLENRSNGGQWTYGGDVTDYPRYEPKNEIHMRQFGPSLINSKEKHRPPVKYTESQGGMDLKSVFSYISNTNNWDMVITDRVADANDTNINNYECEYRANNIFIQYDNSDPLVVPKGISVKFSVGTRSSSVGHFYFGTSKSNVIQQGTADSNFIISASLSVSFKLIFPTDVVVKLANGTSYIIKAGTYNSSSPNGGPPLTSNDMCFTEMRCLDLFSSTAKDYFTQENPDGFTKPPTGTSGGGSSVVNPPSNGGETPGEVTITHPAEFKEGQYE